MRSQTVVTVRTFDGPQVITNDEGPDTGVRSHSQTQVDPLSLVCQ